MTRVNFFSEQEVTTCWRVSGRAHTQRGATTHQTAGWLLPTGSATETLGGRWPPYLVEDSESFPDLLLAVCVLHLPSHHGQELGKVDGTVAFVDKQTEPSHFSGKTARLFTISHECGSSPSASTSLIMS